MLIPDFLTRDDDGEIRLAGHRIGLHDIVYFYNEGFSPEMLLGQFPTLNLALIHKVIAFYLENQAAVDEYVADCEAQIAAHRAGGQRVPSTVELRKRMQSASK